MIRKVAMFLPQLSEETANNLYWCGYALAFLSGLVTLVGLALGAWGDKERERYSEIRISENESVTKQAVKDTALANQTAALAQKETAQLTVRAAALNDRATKSELALEQLKREAGARHIQRDKFLNAIANQPRARVEIMYLRDDPECFELAQEIWQLLQEAKWDVIPPVPIPAPTSASDLGGPVPMSVDGQPSGVTVVANSESEVIESVVGFSTIEQVQGTPFEALKHAFLESLGKIRSWAGGPHQPPAGTLRVVVAPRSGQ